MTTVMFRVLAWTLLVAIAFVTASPLGLRPTTAAPADLERFAAFLGLGLAFNLAYPRHSLWAVGLAAAAALLLEAAQNLTPDRHGHWHDAGVKVAAVVIGGLLAVALRSLAQAGGRSGLRQMPEAEYSGHRPTDRIHRRSATRRERL